MPSKVVTFRDPNSDTIIDATRQALDNPTVSISRLIDAALRVAIGEPIDAIAEELKRHRNVAKTARVDTDLIKGMNNISNEIRIGFTMLSNPGINRSEAIVINQNNKLE